MCAFALMIVWIDTEFGRLRALEGDIWMLNIGRNAAVLCTGFALDALLGDPPDWPHPVRWIGKLIELEENVLREAFPKTPEGERAAGTVMAIDVPWTSVAITWGVCKLAERIHPGLRFAVESFICYQMLAARSLRDESMKVHTALTEGTLEDARHAVSMIVGRDTECLDEAGVARAAVETVAENASDGVIAPLMYGGLAGAPGIVLYKAVNTMDSMVGYKNEQYRNFGTAAAKLDDALNYVPARLSGLIMSAAAELAGFDGENALRIFKRDRKNHTSPNSAHTEAACAGALGVQLGGGNYYFGEYVDKPTIGDDTRPIEADDIPRANQLMYAASALTLGCVAAVGFVAGAIGSGARKGGR